MSHAGPPPGRHPLHNPDAGQHPLPEDPREIDAVLQATRRCYAEHPYFMARYGERGLAFTNSDGGWLVVLSTAWQSHVHEQVSWLCDLLAARGMPSWLMEVHLMLLHQALRERLPGQALRFARLRRAATRLRQQRCARMAQADFDAIAEHFQAQAGPDLANAGRLIVAAVCDERGGRDQAVPSLLRWLADPGRFPARWCCAVDEALVQARATPMPAPSRARPVRPGRRA